VVKNTDQKIKWLRVMTRVMHRIQNAQSLSPSLTALSVYSPSNPGPNPIVSSTISSPPGLTRPGSSPLFGGSKTTFGAQKTNEIPPLALSQNGRLPAEESGRFFSPTEVRLMGVISDNDNRMHELVQNLSNLVREVDGLKRKKKYIITI